jgi:hypothetical protein
VRSALILIEALFARWRLHAWYNANALLLSTCQEGKERRQFKVWTLWAFHKISEKAAPPKESQHIPCRMKEGKIQ